jgi:hypothetical protein
VAVARRELLIRVRFEPARLAEQHLRVAYEILVPIRRAKIGQRVAPETEAKQEEDLKDVGKAR